MSLHRFNVLTSAIVDLALEVVDEVQARLERADPEECRDATLAAYKTELKGLLTGTSNGGGEGAALGGGVKANVIAKGKAGGAKEAKKEKQEKKEKKPQTAYNMYMSLRMPGVKAANPNHRKEFIRLATVGWNKAKFAEFSGAAIAAGIAVNNPGATAQEITRLVVEAYIQAEAPPIPVLDDDVTSVPTTAEDVAGSATTAVQPV
jgi:hypothetical protein